MYLQLNLPYIFLFENVPIDQPQKRSKFNKTYTSISPEFIKLQKMHPAVLINTV